jgi:hypothetical protein
MKTENNKQWDWVGSADLSLENSFGTLDQQRNVPIQFTMGIHEDNNTGWFEFYDLETMGERWYAEGMLWFDGNEVTDYDGVFALPSEIINKLNELRFDTDNIS